MQSNWHNKLSHQLSDHILHSKRGPKQNPRPQVHVHVHVDGSWAQLNGCPLGREEGPGAVQPGVKGVWGLLQWNNGLVFKSEQAPTGQLKGQAARLL